MRFLSKSSGAAFAGAGAGSSFRDVAQDRHGR
jgi:hypothetical protein